MRKQLNDKFARKIESLSVYDPEVASLKRLGVVCVRTAMILTALRAFDRKIDSPKIPCDQDIWNASLELVEVHYEHMSRAISLLNGGKSNKQKLYDLLPDKFTTSEAKKIGEQIHMSDRTIERLLKGYVKDYRLIKDAHGKYSKPNG